MAVLCIMLSMSIAFGIAYINLPSARYRDRLHDKLIESIRTRTNADEGPLQKAEGYNERLADDGAFSEAHHRVRDWIGVLPKEYVVEHGDVIARLFDNPPSASVGESAVSKQYRYFAANKDRWYCIAFTIALPMALLWLIALVTVISEFLGTTVCLDPVLTSKWTMLAMLLTAIAGHACVGRNVHKGRAFVLEDANAFDDALGTLTNAIRGADFRRYFREVAASLERYRRVDPRRSEDNKGSDAQ